MVRAVAMLMVFGATACAGTVSEADTPPVAGEGPCDAVPAQALVGQPASQTLGAETMRLSGATEFRWIPPDSAVTMDYRSTRLNVEYDRSNVVTAIRCG